MVYQRNKIIPNLITQCVVVATLEAKPSNILAPSNLLRPTITFTFCAPNSDLSNAENQTH